MVTLSVRELKLGFTPTILPFGEGRDPFFCRNEDEVSRVVKRNCLVVNAETLCFNRWNRFVNTSDTEV